MTTEVQGMRRRWVIEVHRPGEPVSHVTTRGTDLSPDLMGDRVDVWDDAAKASDVLDAMQGSLDPSTVVYKLAPQHCWCAPEAERDAVARELTEASHRNLAHLAAIRELSAFLDDARAQRDLARAQLAEVRIISDTSALDDSEQVAHLTKERDEARAEYAEAVARNLEHLQTVRQLGQERDEARAQLADVDAGRVERGADRDAALVEVERLRAEVDKQLKALGICDEWIRDRDQTIASLRAEVDERGVREAALEGRLHDCQRVARGLADGLARASERPLSALGRRLGLLRPTFASETDRSAAEADLRSARLLGQLREAESERDALRAEVGALRAAAAEADLANYREERPALYAEVARLQSALAERGAALGSTGLDSTGLDPGQFLWEALHGGYWDSTTTWATTTADRDRYARAESRVRQWGHDALRKQYAEEVARLREARSEQDVKIAQLSDAANRRPLTSEAEARLRSEIDRLRDVVLKDAARGRSVGAPTPAGKRVWACKVLWGLDSELPGGADGPMRVAVKEAFRTLTGRWPDMVFSGWGGQLTEAELRCVEQQESRQVPEASRH